MYWYSHRLLVNEGYMHLSGRLVHGFTPAPWSDIPSVEAGTGMDVTECWCTMNYERPMTLDA